MYKHKAGFPFLVSLLLLSVLQSAVPVARAQEQPQRLRRTTPPAVEAAPTPSPSPVASPTPLASPTPAPAQIRTPSPAQITRTLPELQSRIAEVLRKPELAQAMVGIKVASLDTGQVIFESNSNKLLRPASNMKLYTVAAAIDRLTPDYRFVTSVYSIPKPDAKGVVKGDLIIYGRGDPSIGFRFNEGNYFKGIDDLASRIVAAGVKRVDGDLVGDESHFSGPPYGTGWHWEDLQWWYGAEVSALTVNDNYLDTSVKPGNKIGAPAVITTGPPDPLLRITNHVTTAPNGTKRDLEIYRPLNSDVVEFKGSIALNDGGYTGRMAISRPALLFAYLLRAALAQQGVTIKGKTRSIDSYSGGSVIRKGPMNAAANIALDFNSQPFEITRKESVPFSLVAAQTLKPSQNLYTELILRTLGELSVGSAPVANQSRTSEGRGIEVVRTFLKEAGVDPASLSLTDGSGLSRNDMITAEATLAMLTYMHKHRFANAFREALPIAGVDGTLRNRMKGTVAENNVRAKTGTLSSASSLSGYLTSASGERLVFSIMVNNYPEGTNPPSVCIDPIAVLLASFAGKTEALSEARP
ncbi:MAG TPA: D-alanyl-D-alanine carboxypeptidase/D-alanyl-D-alanine-endopeptidase [Pyrinomonadaceae bacterium]|nr:D-alanyl-D-alanine carboxypeptidase/D-alanyl-D-alanine-endopeptidase [Pyrinomonadaceae bacterium]